MKHILVISIISLFSAAAVAQPTLTAATNNPVAGDVITTVYCDTTGYSGLIEGGASGAGVTWHFDSLVTHNAFPSCYISSAGAPYIDSFPGTNLVSFYSVDAPDTTYTYYTATTDYLAETGSYTSHFPGGLLHNTQTFRYPLTYGDPITVDTTISLDVSTWYIDIDSSIVDAYGTLILPSGTFPNTLRAHDLIYQIDSFSSGSTSILMYEGYSWYQPGFHSALCNMTYNGSGASKYVTNIYYYTQISAGIKGIGKNDMGLEVSPNPAADVVNLKFTLADPLNAAITISDVSGRIAGTVSNAQLTTGLNNIKYPVSGLPQGVYFIHLNSDGNSVTKKIVVER